MDSQHTDLNDIGPSALSHLVGQRSVVEQVRVALEAAFADQRPIDHALLVGPAGCGKTQTAKVIAAEMASEYHEVLGQALESPADLNELLLGTKDRDVVLIDEAALIPNEQQHALLMALDQRKIVLAGGKTGRSPQSIPLKNFSLLLATTDEYKLIAPLIDRMRLVLRFQFYSVEDLTEITRQRCRALNWLIDDDVLPFIARRSRGVPRLALRLVMAARRVARSEGQTRITVDDLDRACSLEGIDLLGLGPTEQQYLRIVAEGTCRLNVIASRLGLPTRTVALTEQVLIRLNFLDKDEGGKRFLTPKAREHLSDSSKDRI